MMRSIIHSLYLFYQSVRPAAWRHSFFPFIAGLSYLWLFLFAIPPSADSIWLLVLFFITTSGFAGTGFFINDFFDITIDAKAGKVNRVSKLSSSKKIILFISIITIALLPWVWLPANVFSWVLIGSQFLLFLLYSLPVIRFKDIWYLSGVTDACYAYVIPLLLSCNTYMLFSGGTLDSGIFLVGASMFFAGFRNILIHQIDDIPNDEKADVITLPQKIGLKKTTSLLWICFLFETCLYLGFLINNALHHQLFLTVSILYPLIIGISFFKKFRKQKKPGIIIMNRVNDHFYQIWMPLLCLFFLITVDIRWSILFFLHLLFLVPGHVYVSFVVMGKRLTIQSVFLFRRVIGQLWYIASLVVNNSIYYFLRFFGIDLVKENKSALEYFKFFFRKK